jgi:hypothetical protein
VNTTMTTTITQLIFRESGGFAGLQRGYTTAPQALPQVPRGQLQHLLQWPEPPANARSPALNLPDMQVYTLELELRMEPAQPAPTSQTAPDPCEPQSPAQPQSRHLVLQFPASDVPDDVSALIDFLRAQATPLPLR